MAADIVEIADALVADLNAHTFTAPYASLGAERLYDPTFTVEQLATLRVSVVPGGWTKEPFTRADYSADHTVDIGVQKYPARTPEEIDALVLLCEEIGAHCLRLDLDAVGARVVAARVDPLYDPTLLRQDKVFISVVTLTLRKVGVG